MQSFTMQYARFLCLMVTLYIQVSAVSVRDNENPGDALNRSARSAQVPRTEDTVPKGSQHRGNAGNLGGATKHLEGTSVGIKENKRGSQKLLTPRGRMWLSAVVIYSCLLYTSPSPRDATLSRMPSSA